MERIIKTSITHPNHHTVGHFFRGWSYVAGKTCTYFCDSWVDTMGYWMVNVKDPLDRKNVSERAIGRTYEELFDWGSCSGPTEDEARQHFELNIKPILHTLNPLQGI